MALLNHKAIINSHSNVVNVVDDDGDTKAMMQVVMKLL